MYSNLVFLELSKPNIGLEKSFWLILITYPGKIITQTKKGYWNNIKELNFPSRKTKIHNDWIIQKLTEEININIIILFFKTYIYFLIDAIFIEII